MTETGAAGTGWRAWVLSGLLLLAALGLRRWVFGLVTVPTASMAPGLLPGDVALYWKFATPAVGDVVALDRDDGVLHIKRLVAEGGEEVEIARGRLYVNGVTTWAGEGDTVSWETDDQRDGSCREHQATSALEARADRPGVSGRWRVIPGGDHERERVPSEGLFLLGDNRGNSSDSRQWGASAGASVRGVVAGVVWSRSPCGEMRMDRVGSLQ